MTIHEIGRIKHVQIQRSNLKVGERPNRRYDPTPLLVVQSLLISPAGAFGLTEDGAHIIDVHHAQHATSRNRGENSISFGFTSHYREMRARFGDHLVDGCAGENILIEAERPYSLADLGQRLAFQNPTTGEIVSLIEVAVAPPCVEFSQFAARLPDPLSSEQMKAALQFLDNGRRAFYATLDGQTGTIQAGDVVLVHD